MKSSRISRAGSSYGTEPVGLRKTMPDGKVEFIYQEIMIGSLQGMVDRLSRPDYSVYEKG
jgi:hypothetical protein